MCELIAIGLLIAAAMSNPKPDANYILIASATFALAGGLGRISEGLRKLVESKKKEN